jgi:alpha-tubulin suppressor-like RCC1 family protein/pimeloyl-ACP methyl ester carboxylesterase
MVAAGPYHTVALKSDGTIWAWGRNGGQLGDGTTTTRLAPVQASNLTGVVSVAAGDSHTVAVKSDGSVWAWGSNFSGQLGDGTTTTRLAPVQVSNLTGVVSVAAGGTHTVAVKSDGSVWAWGNNNVGQLGDGSQTTRLIPVQVTGITNAASVAAGRDFTLVARQDGTVLAWGRNDFGQLGDGTQTMRLAPVDVTGLTGVTRLAAGDLHAIAVKSDGTAWAWGANSWGELGDGSQVTRFIPVQVSGLSGVTSVAAGYNHSVALMSDGTVQGWGNAQSGQLGFIGKLRTSTPVQIPGLAGVTSVATRGGHTAALKSDGTVWASGDNSFGQLGNGAPMYLPTAVQMPAPAGMTSVSAGYQHTVTLKSDGTVWAWGGNDYGQLGDGSTQWKLTPVQVLGMTAVVEVSAGFSHTVARKSDGTVWAWGYNGTGVLGDGSRTTRLTPVQARGLTSMIAVSAGANHTAAVKSDGTVWAWGGNDRGQIGDGSTTNRLAPVQVPGLTGASRVSAGFSHTVALKSDGTVWAWGLNNEGQLGDGSTTDRLSPVVVPGLTDVVSVAAGGSNSVALKSDGTVWAWGSNVTSPSQVPGLTGVVDVAAGYVHMMAVKADGTVWAWGSNNAGQLGDGTGISRSVPVQVPGLSGVSGVAAGFLHTVAVMTDGSASAWGYNCCGQLGNGGPTFTQVRDATGTGFLNVGAAPPPPPSRPFVQLRAVPLTNAVALSVTDTRPATDGPLTIETEVTQGANRQVSRVVVKPGDVVREVFRGLENELPAAVALYQIDAVGTRTPAISTYKATPTPPSEEAAELGAAKPPILLVNGFNSDEKTWKTTLAALNDPELKLKVQAKTLKAAPYDNPCREVLQLRDHITSLKGEYDATRVVVVGHSLGGLVARLYLQAGLDPTSFGEYMYNKDNLGIAMGIECSDALTGIPSFFAAGANDVAALITYGTPHGGADSVFFDLGDKLHPMLRPGSGFLAALNNFGSDAPFPFPKETVVTNIVGKSWPRASDDCVVSTGSQSMASPYAGKPGYSSDEFDEQPVEWRQHSSGACGINLFKAAFATNETDDHEAILEALGAAVLRIKVKSPVNVILTSPSGKVVAKGESAVWGATYDEFEDDTGDRKKVISIPFPERGAYEIRVVPDPTAAPDATFSIDRELGGVTTTLVDRARVADAVSPPMVVSTLVNNLSPYANAGQDRTVRFGSLVALDGSRSVDPDSGPVSLSYAWRLIGGAPVAISGASTIRPTFVASTVGRYTFGLAVSDGSATSSQSSVAITVPRLGDIDKDGDVDVDDLARINAALNTGASDLNDLRDLDGDGRITALDARKLVTLCTRPRCARQ